MSRVEINQDVVPDTRQSPERLYLELMKNCLTRLAFPEPYSPVEPSKLTLSGRAFRALQAVLSPLKLRVVRAKPMNRLEREEGLDWPAQAETMVGIKRLKHLEQCATDVIRKKIPGDFIATGVWRGGACFFLRGVLNAY